MPPNSSASRREPPAPATAPGRQLRAITGGYDLDAWPLSLPPRHDETITGWLRRISYQLGLTPRQLLQAGSSHQLAGNRSVSDLLAGADLLPRLLGFPTSDLAGVYPKPARVCPAAFTSSPHRYCPACLAEDGTWRRGWQSPLALACPHHRLLYQDTCLGCGQPPWAMASWLGDCHEPRACTERISATTSAQDVGDVRRQRPWCHTDLGAAPRVWATRKVLDAQTTLSWYLTPGRAGRPGGPVRFAGMVAHRAQVLDLVATLLRIADNGDRIPTAVLAAEAFRELGDASDATPHLDQIAAQAGLHNVLRSHRPLSAADYGPILTGWYVNRHHAHLPRRTQLAWRVARRWPATPSLSGRSGTAHPDVLPEHDTTPRRPPAEWIPQVLPVSAITAPWPEDPLGRALNAMCLLALGRADPWSHVAIELGLPAHLQHAVTGRLRATSRPEWLAYLTRLEDSFARMRAAPPIINYRARRLLAGNHDQVAGLLEVLQPDADADPLRATRFWSWYTGGHPWFAPVGFTREFPAPAAGPPTHGPDGALFTAAANHLDGIAAEAEHLLPGPVP